MANVWVKKCKELIAITLVCTLVCLGFVLWRERRHVCNGGCIRT